jgi:DNA-binding response OmpR family regulator
MMTSTDRPRRTILIVEDTVDDLNELARILEAAGYHVLSHTNAAGALRAMKRRHPDLVTLDITLDGKESYPLCQQLKALSDAPVLFISVESTASYKVKAFQAGGDDYVTKPFQPEEVLARVRTHLESHGLKAALKEANTQLTAVHDFVSRYFDRVLFRTIERAPNRLRMRKRPATIVFWDIRGFSKLCDALPAQTELVAGFLRDYCDRAARVVDKHGGVLDKFMGDGVMALFGIISREPASVAGGGVILAEKASDPSAPAAEAEVARGAADAVRAALELRQEFDGLVPGWVERWRGKVRVTIPAISLGCGVVSAEPIVGNAGTDFRDQFTAVGPDVNLCARIENKAGKDGLPSILIDQSTETKVRDLFVLTDAGSITDFRNITGSYPLFGVERERSPDEQGAARPWPHTPEQLRSPLDGSEKDPR